MSKRHALDDILNSEFRWPTKGDVPFVEATDSLNNAILAEDDLSRLVLMTDGYKKAADLMVAHTTEHAVDLDFLVFPVLFNYRHFIELSLKYQLATHGRFVGVEANWNSHDLGHLWSSFREMLERYGNPDPDDADPVVEDIVLEFAKIDPASYSYRYPYDRNGHPIPLKYGAMNLKHLSDVMNGVDGYFNGCDGFLSSMNER
ncbi:hypothetical protein [Parasphingopyxis marina]|nr:hypothetical protein [Parasphingopyxis marina]